MNAKQKWILGAVALVLLLVIAGFGYQELQKEAERQAKSQTEEQVQTEEQTGTEKLSEETREKETASQEEEKESTDIQKRRILQCGSGWKADQPERNPGRKAGGDQFLDQQMPALQRGNAGL